jgi:hypothetical protein
LAYLYENNNVFKSVQTWNNNIEKNFFSPSQPTGSSRDFTGYFQWEFAASLTYKYNFASPIKAVHLSANISRGMRGYDYTTYTSRSNTGEASLWVSKDGVNWIPILQPTTPLQSAYETHNYNDLLPSSVLGGTNLYLQYRGTASGMDANLSRFSVANYTIVTGYGTRNTYQMKILTENLTPSGQITLVPATESTVPVKVADLILSDEDLPNLVATISSGFEVRGTGANREIWTTGVTDYETQPNLSFVVSMIDVAGATGNVTGNALLLDNPSEDTDGDGVLDSREIADGTNPNNASSYNGLNKGLVAYYPLDGNMLDASGNNRHGIRQGGAFGENRQGESAKALSFSAGAQYGRIPIGSDLLSGNFTLSAWVKFSSFAFPLNG